MVPTVYPHTVPLAPLHRSYRTPTPYPGTVQGVMVVRVVPWSGPRAAVVQHTTDILWCGARGEVVYGAGCIYNPCTPGTVPITRAHCTYRAPAQYPSHPRAAPIAPPHRTKKAQPILQNWSCLFLQSWLGFGASIRIFMGTERGLNG